MVIFDPILEIIGFIVDIYFKIVVVQVVLHWLIHFKILEPSNKYAQKTVELLEAATRPVYNKINLPHTPSLPQAIAFDDPLGDFRSKFAQGVPLSLSLMRYSIPDTL